PIRLAAAVARAAHAEGGSRLLGAEQEAGQLPYASFVEALRRLVAHALKTCPPPRSARAGEGLPGVARLCRPRRMRRPSPLRCARRRRMRTLRSGRRPGRRKTRG